MVYHPFINIGEVFFRSPHLYLWYIGRTHPHYNGGAHIPSSLKGEDLLVSFQIMKRNPSGSPRGSSSPPRKSSKNNSEMTSQIQQLTNQMQTTALTPHPRRKRGRGGAKRLRHHLQGAIREARKTPVSYTHLTLPTTTRV